MSKTNISQIKKIQEILLAKGLEHNEELQQIEISNQKKRSSNDDESNVDDVLFRRGKDKEYEDQSDYTTFEDYSEAEIVELMTLTIPTLERECDSKIIKIEEQKEKILAFWEDIDPSLAREFDDKFKPYKAIKKKDKKEYLIELKNCIAENEKYLMDLVSIITEIRHIKGYNIETEQIKEIMYDRDPDHDYDDEGIDPTDDEGIDPTDED